VVGGDALDKVRKRFESLSLFETRFVVLFPGGARMTRHWPVGNYKTLAARLSELGWRICVVGSPMEQRDAGAIAEAAGPAGVNLAGRLSIPELAAVLSQASLYVGNDSGPTHLAAALAIPSIALFGPGDAMRFSPRGRGPIRVLQYKVDCSPCYLTWCSHHTCMRSLTIEGVLSNALELLRAPSPFSFRQQETSEMPGTVL
jgi:ADP-heptose:LPS heptosyltransferase